MYAPYTVCLLHRNRPSKNEEQKYVNIVTAEYFIPVTRRPAKFKVWR